jgi:hypothetical protein
MAFGGCIGLAVLQYLGGCLSGFGIIGMVALGRSHGDAVPSGVMAVLVAVQVVFLLILMGSATTFLLCGLRIRRGGRASAIVALLLACLCEIGSLFAAASGVMGEVGSEMRAGHLLGFVLFGVYLLVIAAIGQLIYFLLQILLDRSKHRLWVTIAVLAGSLLLALTLAFASNVARSAASDARDRGPQAAAQNAAAPQPSILSGLAAATGLDSVPDADYCTIALCPRLQDQLKIDQSDVIRRMEWYQMGSSVTAGVFGEDLMHSRSPAPGVPPIGPAVVNVTQRVQDCRNHLAATGRKIAALLTPQQDQQFRSLVASGKLQHVDVTPDVDAAHTTYYGMELNYTHYGEAPPAPHKKIMPDGTEVRAWTTVRTRGTEGNWLRGLIHNANEAIQVLQADDRSLRQYGVMWCLLTHPVITDADKPRLIAALSSAQADNPDKPMQEMISAALRSINVPDAAALRPVTQVTPAQPQPPAGSDLATAKVPPPPVPQVAPPRPNGKPTTPEEAFAALASKDGFRQIDAANFLRTAQMTPAQTVQAKQSLHALIQETEGHFQLQAAADTYVHLTTKNDLQVLIQMANDTRHDVVCAPALVAVLKYDPDAARHILDTHAERIPANYGLRNGMFGILQKEGSASEPTAIELLKVRDRDTLLQAIRFVGTIGTAKSIPALQQLARTATDTPTSHGIQGLIKITIQQIQRRANTPPPQ